MGFKAARVSAGLKQGEVAKRLGVSRISVYNWESNKNAPKSADQLKKVAQLYGVTVDELLRDDEEE